MPRKISALILCLAMPLLTAVATAEVTVVTDKDTYAAGEIVHIAIHNSGPEDVEFNSWPPVQIYNADTNYCPYGCVGLAVMTPFPPGTTVDQSWDTGAVLDAPGPYVVAVNMLVFGGDPVTTGYVLTDGVADDKSVWGSIKALYRD